MGVKSWFPERFGKLCDIRESHTGRYLAEKIRKDEKRLRNTGKVEVGTGEFRIDGNFRERDIILFTIKE